MTTKMTKSARRRIDTHPRIILRRNAGEHTLTVINDNGKQMYDLGVFNNAQLSEVAELVKGFWSRSLPR